MADEQRVATRQAVHMPNLVTVETMEDNDGNRLVEDMNDGLQEIEAAIQAHLQAHGRRTPGGKFELHTVIAVECDGETGRTLFSETYVKRPKPGIVRKQQAQSESGMLAVYGRPARQQTMRLRVPDSEEDENDE